MYQIVWKFVCFRKGQADEKELVGALSIDASKNIKSNILKRYMISLDEDRNS